MSANERFSDGLTLVFTLIEGLGLRQITARIFHELALGVRAAEAVGLALDGRIHGAIRLHVFVVGETPATHIAEFPIGGIGRGGKSDDECDRKHGRGVNPRHRASPLGGNGPRTAPFAVSTQANLFRSCGGWSHTPPRKRRDFQGANVRYWHLADIDFDTAHVRFWKVRRTSGSAVRCRFMT